MNRKWLSFTDHSLPHAFADKFFESGAAPVPDGYTHSTRITYTLNGLWQLEAENKTGITAFALPGGGSTVEEFAPDLPREGLYVAVPDGAERVTVKVVKYEDKVLDGRFEIEPVPKFTLEHEHASLEKGKMYANDSFYPEEIAQFEKMTRVADVRCVHIMLNPVRYNPVTRKVSVLHNIQLDVSWHGDGEQPPIEANDMLNMSPHPRFRIGTEGLGQILFVTPEKFKNCVEELCELKKAKYLAKVVTVESITPKDIPISDSMLKKYLQEEHKKNKIAFVILCGDINAIPIHYYASYLSDSWYATTDDGSDIPLFMVSRLPALSADELNRMAADAIAYMKGLGNKREEVLLLAQHEGPYEKCKNSIDKAIQDKFQVAKRYEKDYPNKTSVIDAVRLGKGFINFRGHGSKTGWAGSNGLSCTDINQMEVGTNKPHVFSICCNTGNIEYSNCFGSVWMKRSNAITFTGATAPSYTQINNFFDVYLWKAIQEQGLTTIGDIYLWATGMLAKNHPCIQTTTNIRMYLMLGDASLDYDDRL